jgi:hypothetical protein
MCEKTILEIVKMKTIFPNKFFGLKVKLKFRINRIWNYIHLENE